LQAAFTNGLVSSKENKITFKGTWHGWKTLFDKSKKAKDAYLDNVFSRNFEIGGGITLGEQNQISGFNTSVKYAIINNRDPKTYKFYQKTKNAQDLNKKFWIC